MGGIHSVLTYLFPGGHENDDLSHNFKSFHEVTHTDPEGNVVDFSQYKGKVVLCVNSARKWGKRRQIQPTIELYNKYKDQGLEILYFPSKSFGRTSTDDPTEGQEPGDIATVVQAYREEFKVPFTIFNFATINGENTSDVYKFLRSAPLKNQSSTKNAVEWNFGKFIVNREGKVIKRYGPAVCPSSFDTEDKMGTWLKE